LVRPVKLSIFIVATALIASPVGADYYFTVPEEIVEVTINADSSLGIEYWTTFANTGEGDPIEVIDVGFNSGDFDPDEMAADMDGNPVESIATSTYIRNGVEIYPEYPIFSNETETLHLKGRNYRRVFEDDEDEEYASVVFGTNYFGEKFCYGTKHLTVRMIFPPGASPDDIKYHSNNGGAPTNAFVREDGRVVYEYIVPDALPYEMYRFGVSFPRYLVTEVRKPPSAFGQLIKDIFGSIWMFVVRNYQSFFYYVLVFSGLWIPLLVFGIIFLGMFIGSRKRKMQYLPPLAKMEGTGIKRGLTAPEVALLMEKPLNAALTLILFGLIKKKSVRIIKEKPLKLEKIHSEETGGLKKYEGETRKAIKKNGELDEQALVKMFDDLIDNLEDKMGGFSYKETVEHYRSILTTAFKMVEEAKTPELAMKEFTNSMQWMMLDDDFEKRSSQVFSRNTYYPMPYWWQSMYPRYYEQEPNIAGGGPGLSGKEIARDFVSTFGDVAKGVVSKVEKFTGKVTSVTNPAPVARSGGSSSGSSGGSSGGGSSCACACACAGCACACAGGGR